MVTAKQKLHSQQSTFSEPHGNHMSYKHTQSLSGKTINKDYIYLKKITEAYDRICVRGGSVTQMSRV